MSAATRITVTEHLRTIPSAVRSTVRAARRIVKAAAPKAKEVAYQSRPPRSKSAMWKIIRYDVDDVNVVGIGAFPTYATLYFHRGRELEDSRGLLAGAGKEMRSIKLRSPADVERLAVKRIVRKAFALGGSKTGRDATSTDHGT